NGNFAKVQHVMPMGSQEKAANPEQFTSWAEKHAYDEYLVEYKLDGASLELQYENGILQHAVTRGDGSIGDDITDNAVKMKGVQKKLEVNGELLPYTGGIRGEVLMYHDVHDSLYSDKANCRNAANGLMKRKDGIGCENLTLMVYDAKAFDGSYSFFSDEEEKMNWLSKCGFETSPLHICKNIQEVIDYRAHVMEIRKSIPYDIDGLVIKERVINAEDASRARPDHQIAFKFSLEEAVSVVRRVIWSESGATYTPIAEFDTVDLNGTKVQRASLANPNTIKELGLKIGSHVVVVKRGEIIPKIESVIPDEEEKDSSPVILPCECSSCHTKLQNDGTRLFCPNKSCPKKLLHQIQKWINVIDITDFGDSLVRALFDAGKISSISSLYSLNAEILTPFFLNEESIAQDKKSLAAQKVASSINSHRNVKLSSFIAGFDIEGIGETLVEKLIEAGFDTLDKIIAAKEEDVASISGFAEIMAHTLIQGIADNKDEMLKLVNDGTISIKAINNTGILANMSFCFTGELATMKRSAAQALVKELGGSVKSSVVKGLTYLVTNDTTSGSSKNVKASKLGIPVIDEKQFLDIVRAK
ncbi:MAG: NAD-dependent DNA ligase LigA, partial [Treponema sp.]|nr:NAD-dependent DNA ligase LigA [Treponema sp.]